MTSNHGRSGTRRSRRYSRGRRDDRRYRDRYRDESRSRRHSSYRDDSRRTRRDYSPDRGRRSSRRNPSRSRSRSMSRDSWSPSRSRSSSRDSRSRSRDSQENGRTRTGGTRQGHDGPERNQGQLIRRNQNVEVADNTLEHMDSRDVYIAGSPFAGNLRVLRKGMTRQDSMRAPGIETEHKGVSVISADVGRHGSASREAVYDAMGKKFDRSGVGRYHIFTAKEPEPDLYRQRESFRRPHRLQLFEGVDVPAGPVLHFAACGADGHSARRCVLTTEDGDLDICPFCERYGEHLPEDCPDRQNF